ncbi:hypothetical protein QTP88_000688 [Uroleucon formosanum]
MLWRWRWWRCGWRRLRWRWRWRWFLNSPFYPTSISMLQGIVNADQIFIDVFAVWPNSSHNQNILENNGSILLLNCHILGDGAYPLTDKFMVPYKDNGHLTQNQKNFNKILSSSRVTYGCIPHKSYCGKIITSACCLHNICMTTGDDFDTEPYVSEIKVGGDLHGGGTRSEVLKNSVKEPKKLTLEVKKKNKDDVKKDEDVLLVKFL